MQTDIIVRERHPLKQGLKHLRDTIHDDSDTVRERHPLKQGLKRSTVPPVRFVVPMFGKDIH